MYKFWKYIDFNFETEISDSFYSKVLSHIKFFYLLLFALATFNFKQVNILINFNPQDEVLFVWPVAWIPNSLLAPIGIALSFTCIILPLIAFYFHKYRTPKILVFLSLFFFWATIYAANNYVFHSMHAMILVCGSFCFLPTNLSLTDSIDKRDKVVRTLWLAIALILLTYTCAGISKLIGSIYDLSNGGISLFSPDILSVTLAKYWDLKTKFQILTPFFIQNDWLNYPFYLFVIFIELIAIYFAFNLKRLSFIGVALIWFHWAADNSMGDPFPTAIWIILYMIVSSPFNRYKI